MMPARFALSDSWERVEAWLPENLCNKSARLVSSSVLSVRGQERSCSWRATARALSSFPDFSHQGSPAQNAHPILRIQPNYVCDEHATNVPQGDEESGVEPRRRRLSAIRLNWR